MTLDEAIARLVPRDIAAMRIEDAHGLTVNLYARSEYRLAGDKLVVGDDGFDKIGVTLDGSGVYFLRGDGDRFVNSSVELLQLFILRYERACEEAAVLGADGDFDGGLNKLCRTFRDLDPAAMDETAAWFNFLDMVRNYP